MSSFLINFKLFQKNPNVRKNGVIDGVHLGNWLSGQRTFFKMGTLLPGRLGSLRSIPEWVKWEKQQKPFKTFKPTTQDAKSSLTDKWLTKFELFLDTPHVRVGTCVNSVNIGAWFYTQRAAFKYGTLTTARLTLLRTSTTWREWELSETKRGAFHKPKRPLIKIRVNKKAGKLPVGAPYDHDTWNKHFELFKTLPDMMQITVKDGIPIGKWRKRQRARFTRGSMPQARLDILRTVPAWVKWETKRVSKQVRKVYTPIRPPVVQPQPVVDNSALVVQPQPVVDNSALFDRWLSIHRKRPMNPPSASMDYCPKRRRKR
jgi:hypothetical protein